jgi:8-oxo-dGTP pyrophosphatase MutT (NUDIX family)
MPHVNELVDFVTTILIVRDDKVLLIGHKKFARADGTPEWMPIGGHIEAWEADVVSAALREVEEETGGIKVSFLRKPPPGLPQPGDRYDHRWLLTPDYMLHHAMGESKAPPGHRHVVLGYYVAWESGEFACSDEHTEGRWFSAEDLEKAGVTPWVKFHALQAIQAAARTNT